MVKWLKRIWLIYFLHKCPICGGKVYCRGPASETETCMVCGWTEWD